MRAARDRIAETSRATPGCCASARRRSRRWTSSRRPGVRRRACEGGGGEAGSKTCTPTGRAYTKSPRSRPWCSSSRQRWRRRNGGWSSATSLAPAGGRIADTMAQPGEMLNAGAPVRVAAAAREHLRSLLRAGDRSGAHPDRRSRGDRLRCMRAAPDRARILHRAAAGIHAAGDLQRSHAQKLVWLIEARPASAEAATLSPGQPVTVRPAP